MYNLLSLREWVYVYVHGPLTTCFILLIAMENNIIGNECMAAMLFEIAIVNSVY